MEKKTSEKIGRFFYFLPLDAFPLLVGTGGFEPSTSFLLCKLCVHRKANDASVKESVTLINFAVACFFANSFYLKSQKLPLEAFLDFNPKQALNGRDRRIRTVDILLPKQALYQAELCPVKQTAMFTIIFLRRLLCSLFISATLVAFYNLYYL